MSSSAAAIIPKKWRSPLTTGRAPSSRPAILDTLKELQIPATFFHLRRERRPLPGAYPAGVERGPRTWQSHFQPSESRHRQPRARDRRNHQHEARAAEHSRALYYLVPRALSRRCGTVHGRGSGPAGDRHATGLRGGGRTDRSARLGPLERERRWQTRAPHSGGNRADRTRSSRRGERQYDPAA